MGSLKRRLFQSLRGFTLLEVLVVVVLLGVLASIVIASLKTNEKEASNTVFAHDIRVAADGFQAYWLRNNSVFPADQAPGVRPPEIDGYLDRMKWDQETPIGGKWDWDSNVFGIAGAMAVYMPERAPTEMLEIDDMMDDGNLMTGNFRVRPAGYMLLIRE